ncbi:glycosyl hydrolase family 18 protein [Propionispora vibrioides]|uniref:Spore germination protein YaaH n=1 Tax=Propionispora vibrioides TaxID=112903 RepID=A0A1H8SMW4_9FIRM|nr:glycosyl hydrolase family 18 protein [Propionispora vibrioides]SEO79694.1 Spore germination protein YaaH [Propionispora vibrioides]
MKYYKLQITWMVLFLMATTIFMPLAPTASAAANPLLAQTTAAGSSSGGGLLDIILGLLLGKLLGSSNDLSNGTKSNNPPATGLGGKSAKDLVGFYAEWWDTDTSSFKAMSQHTDTINTIAPFWATLQSNGTVKDRGGNDHASVVKFAKQNNIPTLLLVNNAKQEKSEIPIHTILANPALRTKSIDSMEAYIKQYGLDGINVDFEMVPAQDRDNLSAFMKELYNRLHPQGYVVSIDVFPKQNEDNDVAAAYDYAALAQYADKIMIMTYDNHGVWSGAGPIADIGWVEKSLQYALQYIPKNKLYLCVPGYGYDWSSKGVESIEYAPAMALAEKYNADIVWDDKAKAPHFDYTAADGTSHQVWFENSKSLSYKLDLVNKYDIAGAALWKLGEEDPGYWQVFKEHGFKK